jgi:enoyl-CoA hydratase
VKALVDLVGPSFAKEILFTARHLDAAAVGLINKVVAPNDLEAKVRRYAEMIGDNAPLTVEAAKIAVREALEDPEKRKLEESAAVDTCFQSADYLEGRKAFMEKRRPVFRGSRIERCADWLLPYSVFLSKRLF